MLKLKLLNAGTGRYYLSDLCFYRITHRVGPPLSHPTSAESSTLRQKHWALDRHQNHGTTNILHSSRRRKLPPSDFIFNTSPRLTLHLVGNRFHLLSSLVSFYRLLDADSPDLKQKATRYGFPIWFHRSPPHHLTCDGRYAQKPAEIQQPQTLSSRFRYF